MRLAHLAPAAAVAVLALADCGGQAHTITTTKTATRTVAATTSTTRAAVRAPSKAQFIAAADRICRRAGRRVAPLLKSLPDGSTDVSQWPGLVPTFKRAQAIKAAELARLRALIEPTADRGTIAAWLHATASVLSR